HRRARHILLPYTTSFRSEVLITPREPEEICYSTEYSTGINQTATTELNENRVFRFPVKYLSKLDPKIQTRYSILVKQYVQSVEGDRKSTRLNSRHVKKS